jgi:hypothetical protein
MTSTLPRTTRRHIGFGFALALITLAACHPGPVVGGGGIPNVGGTIAGIVSTDGNAPVVGRKVTVIETTSGTRFDATTGANGGYTIKVPQGTYRIEVELLGNERVAKQPDPTKIDKSDLDPHRDIIITVR